MGGPLFSCFATRRLSWSLVVVLLVISGTAAAGRDRRKQRTTKDPRFVESTWPSRRNTSKAIPLRHGRLWFKLSENAFFAAETVVDEVGRRLLMCARDPLQHKTTRQRALTTLCRVNQRLGQFLADLTPNEVKADKQQTQRLERWIERELTPFRLDQYNPSIDRSAGKLASNTIYLGLDLISRNRKGKTDRWRAALAKYIERGQRGNLHVVGITSGGGPLAGMVHALLPKRAQDSTFGLLLPKRDVANGFVSTISPKKGDTVLLLDDFVATGDTAKAAIAWVKRTHPAVHILFASFAWGPHEYHDVKIDYAGRWGDL
jgi:pyrimidine operon attenuation protein/uracil phosphoribosyltransferase